MNNSILIADDHPLILKGLNDFLVENGYNVLARAKDGREAYQLIKEKQPDIAILDIRMPYLDGLEIARKCHEEELSTKIVLITFEKDEALYEQAKGLNIYGYVLKEFALEEIENCLNSVQNNIPYFSPELLEFLEVDESVKALHLLTTTEKEILRLISENKTAKEIGEQMYISSRTVEKHKSNIIKKLDITPFQNNLLIWVKENQRHLS
ncbi:LuxR family two component transcriptional regulator [Flavobacteriaceae bacterium MAR_2010_72]|nr:LuxR family two component transcriptional regulator [Flavobacteriaceae bacterium MAR_2010_72]TVZ58534.1 LuxR family two component transcriptional regulator [Flavobacteriaceae bacterium MAR_2010_105]